MLLYNTLFDHVNTFSDLGKTLNLKFELRICRIGLAQRVQSAYKLGRFLPSPVDPYPDKCFSYRPLGNKREKPMRARGLSVHPERFVWMFILTSEPNLTSLEGIILRWPMNFMKTAIDQTQMRHGQLVLNLHNSARTAASERKT